MEEERVLSADKQREDDDASLRPQTLAEYVGQSDLKENLEVFIKAAKMRDEALYQYETEKAFKRAFQKYREDIKAKDIIGDETKINPDSPIYKKRCVFTGKLEKFTRVQAMQVVADLGGINEDRVTKNTNFLILGNNDYCSTIKDGKSSKQKKAEKNKLAGQDIEIVPETVFYDMLGE